MSSIYQYLYEISSSKYILKGHTSKSYGRSSIVNEENVKTRYEYEVYITLVGRSIKPTVLCNNTTLVQADDQSSDFHSKKTDLNSCLQQIREKFIKVTMNARIRCFVVGLAFLLAVQAQDQPDQSGKYCYAYLYFYPNIL